MEGDDEKWNEVRDFYRKKKMDWAKKTSYYTDKNGGHPEWGTLSGDDEPAGYDLKPPYTLEEVDALEQSQGITLPVDLKTYLTTVSRELFVTSYPMVFSLRATIEGEFNVPAEKRYWDFGNCLLHPNDDCTCVKDMTTGGTLEIGDGGCTDTDLIVLKGATHYYGSVWRVGGDSVYHSYPTFWEYVYEPIKREKRPAMAPSLEQYAVAYNQLRFFEKFYQVINK
jgi:hypothetical protein